MTVVLVWSWKASGGTFKVRPRLRSLWVTIWDSNGSSAEVLGKGSAGSVAGKKKPLWLASSGLRGK